MAKPEKHPYQREPVLFEPIEKFLAPRSLNALRKVGYDFVFIGEFLLLPESVISAIPGIGRKAWQDFRYRLYAKGLCIAILLTDPYDAHRKAFLADIVQERAQLGR